MDSLIDPLLPSTRVARLLGIEVETLGTWRRRGYGPQWYKIGKKIQYSEIDLRSWMLGQVHPAGSMRRADGFPGAGQ
jgi:hypothetical protein